MTRRGRSTRTRATLGSGFAVLLLAAMLAPAFAGAVTCDGEQATIIGSAADDTIVGTPGPDIIHGLGGDDTINGLGGDDLICGGAGDDTIVGGDGIDRIIGGAGDDQITGGRGADTVIGNAGDDRLRGGPGADTVLGGIGDDQVGGGADDDHLGGGPGSDRLNGHRGDDALNGGTDDDRLGGAAGNDTIQAGAGNDHAGGGPGDDMIDGGTGDDLVSGGSGNDVVHGGEGSDHVRGGDGDDHLYGGEDAARASEVDTCTGGNGMDIAIACEGVAADTEVSDTEPALSPSSGAVALTFDDGPHPTRTPIVLDILDEYGVKATFFVVGWRVDANPELTAEIARRGHSVQNHAYGHQLLTAQSSSYAAKLISDGAAAIEAATGARPQCLRPPWGSVNDRVREIASDLRQGISLWEADSRDYASQEANAIVRQVLSITDPGEVVLMHDTIPATGRALPAIIEGLRERGIAFETICDNAALDHRYDELRRHEPQ